MVVSKLNKLVEYAEHKTLEKTDEQQMMDLYEANIHGKLTRVAIGAPQQRKDHNITYFPIYLVHNGNEAVRIGVYETLSSNMSRCQNVNGTLNLSCFSGPLLFSFATPSFIQSKEYTQHTKNKEKEKDKEKDKEKEKDIHYVLLKNKNVLQTQHKSQHKSQHSQLARFFTAHDFIQELNKDSNLTPSNVRFLSINLTHNNKTYEINLKTDEHDFHVEHMKLNASFFHYYLTQVLKVEIHENENDFQYTLTIIDDNVNVIEFTHHDYIVLLRDECFIKQHVH